MTLLTATAALSPQKSAASCDVRHVTRRGRVGLFKTPEAAPIHLDGPMRLGLARAFSEREDAVDKGQREQQRHLELEALRSTRSLRAR
jgi:hypothetical protein